ncbi:MAG: hypothetical protein ACK4TK_11600, partial [Thiobacillaceae bacterium]
MKTRLSLLLALFPASVLAHHGVASLGAAGLEGPGAPVETSSSATLPQGKWLGYLKLDHAKFRTYDPADATEADTAQYWMLGLGYGFTPWFSAYLFQPYNLKKDEADGSKSRGFTDSNLMGVLGFKYDEGLRLTPANESLDDLMDWHFTAYAGLTLPTGEANHRLQDGSIDPGMSLGFGKSSFAYGLTATRQVTSDATLVFEVGQMRFQRYTYADGQSMRFGTETRVNAAWAQRLQTLPERRFRLDGNLELNYLGLGRDRSGSGPEA